MTTHLNDNIIKRAFNYANDASQELTDKVKSALTKSTTAQSIMPGDDPTYKGWGANPSGAPLTTTTTEKNNTMLYVGIGAAVLAVAYFAFKK